MTTNESPQFVEHFDWKDGVATLRHHFSSRMWQGWVKELGPQITSLGAELTAREIPLPAVMQVKEKLGELRIYARFTEEVENETAYWFHDQVQQITRTSGKTCRRCGAPCQTREVSGWYSPICTDCMRYERLKEQQEKHII